MFLISKPVCKKIIQPIIQPQLLKRTKGTYVNDFFGSFSKKFMKQRVVILHAVIAFKKNSYMQMLHWAIFDLCMGYKSFWVAFQNGGDLKLIWRLFCLSFCFRYEPVEFLVKNFAMLELKLELNRNNMLRISTISMIDMQRKMDRRFIVYEFKYFYCKGCFFFLTP